MIYLSLCIPTNGIAEWVFPVLDAIYKQNADSGLYEVIVTDNGENHDFYNKMTRYAKKHSNLTYKKTEAYLFENQIEALRVAKGEYLKFLNHRSVMEDGSIKWLIDIVKSTMKEKPIMYFSNGSLGHYLKREYATFDHFVAGLKHMASWTTGVGVWRSDFSRIPVNHAYNKISPHSDVLFYEKKRNKYIIDDSVWMHDIDSSHKQKGKYDLYKAFGIEEISITVRLYTNGDISINTLKSVIYSYKKFVASCYLDFNIFHEECSYHIDGFKDAMGIYMSEGEILRMAISGIPRAIAKRLHRLICCHFCGRKKNAVDVS